MKNFSILFLSLVALLATSLQAASSSFSTIDRDLLLKELQSSSSILYTSKTYDLKNGWNKLTTPKDGVNVVKTFEDVSTVKFVVTYDDVSKLWAMYNPDKSFKEDEILFLKYLEPNVTFFVLAEKNENVNIQSNVVNESCKKMMEDSNYAFVLDSGISRDYTLSKDKTIELQSRYYSHHQKGVYNDTRVMLIYPKLGAKTTRSYKYGPALPKIAMKFAKEYEGELFYVYDYKEQKCFMGRIPSMKIPPIPVLKEI